MFLAVLLIRDEIFFEKFWGRLCLFFEFGVWAFIGVSEGGGF
jgi:hypothetical protein